MSIYTVADRAGVSIATVSRVLANSGPVADATRRRVLRVAHDLGWQPSRVARGLAGKGHGTTAIIFPDLFGQYFAQVVGGFEEEIVADDRSLLVLATHGRANVDAMVLGLADRVDGIVIMDRTVSDAVVRGLEARGTPTLLLARPPVDEVPAVCTENVEATKALTGHLLDHGRAPLVFLGDTAAAPDVHERWRGFVAAHAQAGVTKPEKAVSTGFFQEDGNAAALELLGRATPPRGIVCANDELALGVYEAARDRGVAIPDELAVTGWDDIAPARALNPPLSTVKQPMRALGARAAALLLERLRGGNPPSETLPTTLHIRGSCGCRA